MNLILLQPTDVLFFRDGRPMSGSLAGHTAAWPLPDITNHALLAALHRATLEGVHGHDHHRSDGSRVADARQFGSLLTVGPFPVRVVQTVREISDSRPRNALSTWFFPRPKDSQENRSVRVTLRPVQSLTKGHDDPWLGSSLPAPLEYAVASTQPPNKEIGGEPWLSAAAFGSYLRDGGEEFSSDKSDVHFLQDDSIADKEAHLGIGIDPETQTTGQGVAEGQIYTAHYLRLREGFRLGVLAEAMDKVNGDPENKRDLIQLLLNGRPTQLIVGGQQRICTAERVDSNGLLPLPRGLSSAADFQPLPHGKFAVKWVLLSPAIWPGIPAFKKGR